MDADQIKRSEQIRKRCFVQSDFVLSGSSSFLVPDCSVTQIRDGWREDSESSERPLQQQAPMRHSSVSLQCRDKQGEVGLMENILQMGRHYTVLVLARFIHGGIPQSSPRASGKLALLAAAALVPEKEDERV